MVSRERNDVEINIAAVRLKFVKKFKYQGVYINEKYDTEIEITKRIGSYTNNL